MNTDKKKQIALRWRIVRYAITVIAVLIVTTLLFFLMMGYRYNKDNGTVEQGGLVNFISKPSGARVTVGAATLASRTQSKITLYPGEYAVAMERDGYLPWKRDITVTAGEVLWLNSARLIPKSPKTTVVTEYDGLRQVAMSVSGRKMAAISDDTKPELQITTLTDGAVSSPLSIVLQEADYSEGESHIFQLVKWSHDNKRLLVRHSFDDKQELLVVDTGDATRTTRLLPSDDVVPLETKLDPRSDTDFFVRYSDNSIRAVDGVSGVVSAPLLSDIASFELSENAIYYSLLPKDGVVETGYLTLGATKSKRLAVYATAEPVRIAPAHYFSEYYTATSIGTEIRVNRYAGLPQSDSRNTPKVVSAKTFSVPSLPEQVVARYEDRFLTFASPSFVTTYDLELKKYRTTNLSSTSGARTPDWFDGQHFWTDTGAVLRMYEYDGANQTAIVPVTPGFSAALTPSGRYLYSIAKTDTGYALQRTRIIL